MKLQELIDQTELDMTVAQVKAFFLGVLCAEKPMPFPKAIDELLTEAPEVKASLEPSLIKLWDELKTNLKTELKNMFPLDEVDLNTFMEISKDQLDYFLTAMSLSGTNAESCNDEELAELIEELEETVADMDDFLSEEDNENGEEFKESLLETWTEFVSSKK